MRTFKFFRLTLLAFLLPLLLANAQESEKIYVVNTFLKVKPGMGEEYTKLEKAWKKIHLNRISKNEIGGWSLYTIPNAGTENAYNMVTVTVLRGDSQMARFYGEYDLTEYVTGLSKEEIELVKNTPNYRDMVREEVYLLRDAKSKNMGSSPNIIWQMAFKLYKGVSADDFVNVEKKLTNPVIENLLAKNDIEYFGLFERKLPSGSRSEFDMVRSFGYPDLETMLAFPEKYFSQFAQSNPNFIGTGWKIDDSELVAVELWKKIDCTCQE